MYLQLYWSACAISLITFTSQIVILKEKEEKNNTVQLALPSFLCPPSLSIFFPHFPSPSLIPFPSPSFFPFPSPLLFLFPSLPLSLHHPPLALLPIRREKPSPPDGEARLPGARGGCAERPPLLARISDILSFQLRSCSIRITVIAITFVVMMMVIIFHLQPYFVGRPGDMGSRLPVNKQGLTSLISVQMTYDVLG